MTVVQGFPPTAASVPAARRSAVAALRGDDLGSVEDDVRTVVTELATNAVLHAQTPFTVAVTVGAEHVRVAVSDGSPSQPRPSRLRDAQASTGRGLLMVAGLSSSWGVEPDPSGAGKTVWCEIAVAAGPRAHAAADQDVDDLDALLARYDDDGPVAAGTGQDPG